MRKPNGVIMRLHRLVTEAPEGMVVDHLNGDKLDNRRSNLRVCTQADNTRNRKGTRGYCWDKTKGKWMVRYGRQFYGRYTTEEEAKQAYQLAVSGVPYQKSEHGRRKYLPKGVLYMKSQSKFGRPFYIRPQIQGVRYFRGYYASAEEAEKAYKLLMEELGKEK